MLVITTRVLVYTILCVHLFIFVHHIMCVFTLAIHTIVFLFSRPPSLAVGRLGVAPFTCARDLLSPLPAELKPGRTDLLHQCHQLAAEVVSLGGGRRYDVPLNVLQELTQGGVKREEAVKEEEDEEEEEVDAFEVGSVNELEVTIDLSGVTEEI